MAEPLGLDVLAHYSDHIVRRQRPPDPLQRELADRLDRHGVLDLHQHSWTDEDLSGLRLITQPRRDVGHRADGGIVEASLEADGSERGEAVRNPDAEANVVPQPTPIDRETAWGVRGRQAAKQQRAKTNRPATVGAQQKLLCQHAEARCPASLPALPVGNMIRATATRSSKSSLLGSDSGKTSHR